MKQYTHRPNHWLKHLCSRCCPMKLPAIETFVLSSNTLSRCERQDNNFARPSHASLLLDFFRPEPIGALAGR